MTNMLKVTYAKLYCAETYVQMTCENEIISTRFKHANFNLQLALGLWKYALNRLKC